MEHEDEEYVRSVETMLRPSKLPWILVGIVIVISAVGALTLWTRLSAERRTAAEANEAAESAKASLRKATDELAALRTKVERLESEVKTLTEERDELKAAASRPEGEVEPAKAPPARSKKAKRRRR